jgi:hypothetical protein
MQSRPPRYEIQRPVEFRVLNGGKHIEGTGRTLNISPGGLLFQTENLPGIGDKIECMIAMGPGLVDDTEAVNLQVHGITLRSMSGKVAVAIKKYSLRPAPPPKPSDSSA